MMAGIIQASRAVGRGYVRIVKAFLAKEAFIAH
jgi:hypothetical protein